MRGKIHNCEVAMKAIGNRGQLFSLDFLIAMGLAVLAMGMLLNYFETTTNVEKEARVQNELNIVAMNASALVLEDADSKCPEGIFSAQGYKVYGCAIAGPENSGFGNIKKEDLMIPDTFKCDISWTGGDNNDCDDDPSSAGNIASVERIFLERSQSLAKADYEKCAQGQSCSAYTQNTLTVKIWK